MQKKWKKRLISMVLCSLLIVGGVTLTIMLIIMSYGPGFPKNNVTKGTIIAYTSVSYLSAGGLGLIACYKGHKSWLYGLHISLEVLFMLFSGIGYITLHKSMEIYFMKDCTPVNGTCICKNKDLRATCNVVFRQENLLTIVNILHIATWIFLCLEFIVSCYVSFCAQGSKPPGDLSTKPPPEREEDKPTVFSIATQNLGQFLF